MAPPSSAKKRKRDVNDDGGAADGKISLTLSSQPSSSVGPVLANFPSVKPSKTTSFKCYKLSHGTSKSKTEDEEDTSFAEMPTLIAGETDAVEFFSSDETRQASSGSRYYVAVHRKSTGTTTLRPVPLHLLTQRVKALKSIQPAPVSALQRLEARAALGETFGTKKAQAAIRAQERNKVDVSAMRDVAGYLQDSIAANTQSLPTQEEAKASADSARLVPKYNADALTPQDIYPLHNIIPEAEWKSISVSSMTAAKTQSERTSLLPFRRSNWINQHLNQAFAAPSPNKTVLRTLFYISTLLAFRQAAFRSVDRSAIQEKFPQVPSIIIDGIISRFTESGRDATKLQSTTRSETLLLAHTFALCLRVDDFASDTTLIASDLQKPVTTINQLFKSLGCTINKLTQSDLKRLGLPDSAAETKRAVLSAPLEFPKQRMKRRA
ncbi:Rpa49 subunit specific to nuclear RNA polymerase I [Coniophora puteana RWD-64-598 SS2]|uniref:Rpa49 subunit specific to nuclear RNA polymerase I n=1 Tax=Coniophora puteana (strain RWD-64-598) TaxID=741705 RepID=A0A5M3MBK3_CONPW|nr:Rpa49 subunit specific to nuclear RNA polymerase I [Coniophora puteana RWD-64-598 SS2]EIW76612.1 Rpa49 subunit specific to nuclear RNA polymerase I [Coniophora puteana RWD-64-598 SS2]